LKDENARLNYRIEILSRNLKELIANDVIVHKCEINLS